MGSGPLKVLLLHGGPAFTHAYLESFESFLPSAGIQIIYYDQLGCGESDQPDDESLWNTPRYLAEVEEVRTALDLDSFILLGHSWGGILTMEYALKHQDDGHLKGIVISNMVAGMQAFMACSKRWKETLSPELQKTLASLEADSDYKNPEYERIMMEELYPQMICRVLPWPEPVTRAFKNVNMKIYIQMQGPSEFVVEGNLKDWEFWDQLPKIQTKALVLGAEFDEMDPKDIHTMAELMPNAEAVICPGGSHLAMWDSQEAYFTSILNFLDKL